MLQLDVCPLLFSVETYIKDMLPPGWRCPRCGYPNESEIMTCAMCDYPKPDSESYIDLPEDDREQERV